MIRIIQGDLCDPRVVDLLHIHLTRARAETAPGSAHALDLTELQSPDTSFWTIWDDETLFGVGALKRLSAGHGEVKSMYTAQSMRGRGAGSAMLRHIIATARASGMSRLSLETGSWEYFRPARTLYRSHGFVECQPFADYVLDPNSVFMSLDLNKSRSAGGPLGIRRPKCQVIVEAHRSCHRRICFALPIFMPSQDLFRPTNFPAVAGFEFASMCERAKKLNGTLDIDSVFMAFFCLGWIDFVSSPSTMAV